MVDMLRVYPGRGSVVYEVEYSEGEHVHTTQVNIVTHPVNIVNTLDVGYYNQTTEAHALHTQDFINLLFDRHRFITSDDIDKVKYK